MQIKTSELTGPALDWAVQYALIGRKPLDYVEARDNFSTCWTKGGPIIERELFKLFRNVGGAFTAQIKRRVPYYSPTYDADIGRDETISAAGPTPLIAAMRGYVASKLGDTVDVPEQLTKD